MAYLVALILLFAPPESFAAPSTTLDGDWTGGFIHDGDWVTVDLTLKSGPKGFDGISDIAFTDYEEQRGVTLTATALEGSRVRFTVPTDRGPVAFDGRLIEGINGGPREFPRMKRFVPGYWDAMAGWVTKRFVR